MDDGDFGRALATVGLARIQGGGQTKIILLTENGYLLLVKSFTDDLAWRVQRSLANAYSIRLIDSEILFSFMYQLEGKKLS